MTVLPIGHRIFLLLGSNVGNTTQNIRHAAEVIAQKAGPITRASAIYRTAPWGKSDQPWFLNQAIELSTVVGPEELLTILQEIETTLGREKEIKWGPRVIDIDLLLYDDQVISKSGLTVPHPLMAARRFVLFPLAEIAGDITHPVLKKSIRQLLEQTTDTLAVEPLTSDAADLGRRRDFPDQPL